MKNFSQQKLILQNTSAVRGRMAKSRTNDPL